MSQELSFGQVIKKLRMESGFTANELNQRLGEMHVSSSYLTCIETKGEIPAYNLIIRLALVLGYDANKLIELAKKEKLKEYSDKLDLKMPRWK